ncbi:MAG TPA: potassium transporter Kup [Casimicrobiaceae bacterium]|nr:potassium transporter Kup [Casimicrobiaceae bacterium]
MTMTPAGRRPMAPLILGAIGIVFGDIGTSPLYTMRQVFTGKQGMPLTPDNVYGLLSLVFWALVVIVTFKYVVLVMRADNRGEGGQLALTALMARGLDRNDRLRWWLVGLGIFGAAMFFGDAMITPAISVLSAVEGIEIATPALRDFIIPITLAILVALFAIQKRGTATVAKLFGPVTVVWFITLATLGALQIAERPSVLAALSPDYAFRFVIDHPLATFLSLGAVVLAVTGTEALYTDMGHFGASPIRRAWVFFVFPALVLNYFGQGALLLAQPEAIRSPFYLLAPTWFLVPLVVLATFATVIASQAVISGAFSLARQAVQMGYAPRLEMTHTNEREIGQIYVPFVNWTLFVAVMALVVGFGSSSALAGAYGIAVTMAMMIDTVLIFFVMIRVWRWPLAGAVALMLPLALIDISFLSSNALKIPDGGWFPLVIGAIVFTLLTTWKRGRGILMDRLFQETMPLDAFIPSIEASPPRRVPGTAIFMTSTPDRVPQALLHNLKHNKVLHERVVFLTISMLDVPYVLDEEERYAVKPLGAQFYKMTGFYGFKEDPNVPELLELATSEGFLFDMMETSFFLSRETLIATAVAGMALWREKLFVAMSKNAVKSSDFFSVPTNRVVELGTQVQL